MQPGSREAKHVADGHRLDSVHRSGAAGHVHRVSDSLADPGEHRRRELVGRALAKDPAQRWTDAGEMARAARACAEALTSAERNLVFGAVLVEFKNELRDLVGIRR